MLKLMPEAEYWATLPRKAVAASVFFLNSKKEILLVRQNYSDRLWIFPGGVVEKRESPIKAAAREVKEEIGYTAPKLRFISVSYIETPGKRNDGLRFLFSGGTLSASEIKGLKIDPEEIAEWGFFPLSKALKLVEPTIVSRVKHAYKHPKGTDNYITS